MLNRWLIAAAIVVSAVVVVMLKSANSRTGADPAIAMSGAGGRSWAAELHECSADVADSRIRALYVDRKSNFIAMARILQKYAGELLYITRRSISGDGAEFILAGPRRNEAQWIRNDLRGESVTMDAIARESGIDGADLARIRLLMSESAVIACWPFSHEGIMCHEFVVWQPPIAVSVLSKSIAYVAQPGPVRRFNETNLVPWVSDSSEFIPLSDAGWHIHTFERMR